MKLTRKEADVLAAVELRAKMTVDQIREETGYRSHTIRYALGHLRQQQIIKRLPLINVSALGYSIFNFVFSIENGCKVHKQALIKSLMQVPQVLQISELGSEFEFGLSICAKSVGDVANILRHQSRRFENFLSKRAISTQFVKTYLPRRYLTSTLMHSKPLQIRIPKEVVEIDELDDRILKILSLGGEATRPSIARQLAIPLSTLELRIRKLEERKVIAGYIYRVSPSVYQMQTYLLLIQAKRLNREVLSKLYVFSEQQPAIVNVSECFGSWDFELTLEVHRGEEVSSLTQELFEVLGEEIHSLRTLSKFQDLKYQFYPGAGVLESEPLQVAV